MKKIKPVVVIAACVLFALSFNKPRAATFYPHADNDYNFTRDVSVVDGACDADMMLSSGFALMSPFDPSPAQFDQIRLSVHAPMLHANADSPFLSVFIDTDNTGVIARPRKGRFMIVQFPAQHVCDNIRAVYDRTKREGYSDDYTN